MATHDCADNARPFYERAQDLPGGLCMKLDLFEAVIFDLDGTLIDTVGDFVLALNHMLTLLPLPAGTPTTVSRDTVEQLTKLRDLHASGALDDEEYARAKSAVLGGD